MPMFITVNWPGQAARETPAKCRERTLDGITVLQGTTVIVTTDKGTFQPRGKIFE